MKREAKLILPCLVLVTLVQTASAFNYKDGDLLLIFRKDGFNDVEFNIGSVSNFLGKASGTKVPVSNWDAALVRSNFNNSLSSVKFLLLGATAITETPRRIWSTSATLFPSAPPTDYSGSRWSSLQSKISYVGTEASAVSGTNSGTVYAVAAREVSSFTYIMSNGGEVDASTAGGLSAFPVETENPATLLFYETTVSNAAIKPPADLLGSFCLDASGALSFTSGPLAPLPAPAILNFSRAGNTNSVTFTTATCGNYRLRSASALPGPWTSLGTTVPGDGTPKTLTDVISGSTRFYQVEANQ